MPAWITPLLWPGLCRAAALSFSRIMIEERGRARKISRAAARPMIPAPMMAKSYLMRRSAIAGMNLPSGRDFETHGIYCAAARPSHRQASVAHVDCLFVFFNRSSQDRFWQRHQTVDGNLQVR